MTRREERAAYAQALAGEVRRTGRALLLMAHKIEREGFTPGVDQLMWRLNYHLQALSSAEFRLQENDLAGALRFWTPGRKGGCCARTR